MRAATFLFFVLALACRASPPPRPQDLGAWWTTVTFDPKGDSLAGTPIQALDSTWVAAQVLSRDLMPIDSNLAQANLRFEFDADFNHDRMPDRVLVGVYRNNRGERGRFLLFLTQRDGRWQKAELAQEKGLPGFSILTLRGDTVSWYDCLRCDFSLDFAWNGLKYELLPSEPSPE